MGASNSIRVSEELFTAARERGDVLCRSTAQQLEHWARLGAALERAGLTVEDMVALLGHRQETGDFASAAAMWRRKRAAQARDIGLLEAGGATWEQMAWISRDVAKSARMLNGPY